MRRTADWVVPASPSWPPPVSPYRVGYGALLPALPGWLASLEPSLSASTIAEQVGELSGIYMLGVMRNAVGSDGRLPGV